MTTRDPEKRRASTLRYRERVHRERFGEGAVRLAFGESAVALLPAMVRDGRLIRRLELNAGLGRMTWHYWLPISAVPHA